MFCENFLSSVKQTCMRYKSRSLILTDLQGTFDVKYVERIILCNLNYSTEFTFRFVNAFVYYGISFNTNELAGDPFVNFALSGAVEFPAYFLSIFALKYWGRRMPLAVTMITAGMSCLLAYVLPEGKFTNIHPYY